MINLSQADTIDERVINTKKCTQFTMTVSALTFETQKIVKSKSRFLKISLNGSISLTRWVFMHVLWGHSIDVEIATVQIVFFIPTLNLPLTGNFIHLDLKKTLFCMIYRLFSSWRPKNVPTRTIILDVIFVGTFFSQYCKVYLNHTHTKTFPGHILHQKY